MSLPNLDPEARRAALEKATQARQIRAELKQMLKAGEVSLREVLERSRDAEPLAKMRVVDVIEAMPAHGPVKAGRVMDDLGISPTRRLRGLGSRQRDALLAYFEASS